MPAHDFRSPRLYVDAPLGEGRTVALEREQSNYLGNVLRLVAGDRVLVFNGSDGEWRASIAGRKRPDTLPSFVPKKLRGIRFQFDRNAGWGSGLVADSAAVSDCQFRVDGLPVRQQVLRRRTRDVLLAG